MRIRKKQPKNKQALKSRDEHKHEHHHHEHHHHEHHHHEHHHHEHHHEHTNKDQFTMNRRDFLRVSGALSAGIALAATGCQMPVEPVVPFVERPEGLRTLGKPKYYATVLNDIPVIVRTREGRPILLVSNPEHPAKSDLSLQTQAALLDLYDPDRAKEPLNVQRGEILPMAGEWELIGKNIADGLEKHKNKIAIITPPLSGVATNAALDELKKVYGVKHLTYKPYNNSVITDTWKACFGDGSIAKPRFDKASLLVGLGAEFIDYPKSGSEKQFASVHNPENPDKMSRFIAFEGRLTLTGANADSRYRVRDSHLPFVAMALAHEIIVNRKIGPLVTNDSVNKVLSKYTAESVATKTGVKAVDIKSIAGELAKSKGSALVWGSGTASTGVNGEQLEVAINLINYSLDAFGNTILIEPAANKNVSTLDDIKKLIDDMNSGKIKMLLIHGVNPAYDLPKSFGFSEALKKLELSVSLNDRLDETSKLMDVLAPASHALESWGDAYPAYNLYSIQQPVIRPLYSTFGFLDILIAWGSLGGKIKEFSEAVKRASTAKDKQAENHSPAYHFIQNYWKKNIKNFEQKNLYRKPETVKDFRTFWETTLGRGFLELTKIPLPPTEFNVFAISALKKFTTSTIDTLELQLFPHPALYDGASANNGWLQEFPDPISRICWGDWLAIAPKRFDSMGLENGDLVKVKINGQDYKYPAFRQAGMHDNQLAIPLGLGRTDVGEVGNNVGRNTFSFLDAKRGQLVRSAIEVSIRKTGEKETLAIPQGADVIDTERRPLVPITNLNEYKKDPKAGTGQTPGGPSAWEKHPYEGTRWAMAIDLSRCNGCGKCSIACQSENNIPVVGKAEVINGREMSWIRIDRYYEAPRKEGGWSDVVWDGPLEVVEEPKTVFEPMLCQHCENAPCETVCPFVATMHSEDGINQQVYNRCVGTRYCANNCPFKVRRYNWFEYSKERTSAFFNLLVPQMKEHARLNVRGRMQMKNNPEVTVRSRGVMEKCSFCIQRIREAQAQATREGRPKELKDGEVIPACMESCPTDAIVFGNINDPDSKIAKLEKDPRAMKLLELTGVKPAISYLTKVRNDKS